MADDTSIRLETRDPEDARARHLAQLPRQIAYAKANAPAFARILRRRRRRIDHDSRAALAQLPVTRKSELLDLQKPTARSAASRAARWGEAGARLRVARPDLRAGGPPRPTIGVSRARCSPRVFAAAISSTTAFRTTSRPRARCWKPARMRSAAPCFPAGTGQTELQVQAMAELEPTGYVGTPSFLRIILEKADEMGVALPSLDKALVSAEAFPREPSATRSLARGIAGYQATRRPTSARSPTRRERAKASSSTKACSWKSCGPAPATRWRRAKSAKSS